VHDCHSLPVDHAAQTSQGVALPRDEDGKPRPTEGVLAQQRVSEPGAPAITHGRTDAESLYRLPRRPPPRAGRTNGVVCGSVRTAIPGTRAPSCPPPAPGQPAPHRLCWRAWTPASGAGHAPTWTLRGCSATKHARRQWQQRNNASACRGGVAGWCRRGLQWGEAGNGALVSGGRRLRIRSAAVLQWRTAPPHAGPSAKGAQHFCRTWARTTAAARAAYLPDRLLAAVDAKAAKGLSLVAPQGRQAAHRQLPEQRRPRAQRAAPAG
jgi:hypothetical protein